MIYPRIVTMYIYIYMCVSIYIYIYLSIYLPIYLSIYLSHIMIASLFSGCCWCLLVLVMYTKLRPSGRGGLHLFSFGHHRLHHAGLGQPPRDTRPSPHMTQVALRRKGRWDWIVLGGFNGGSPSHHGFQREVMVY